MLSALIVDDNHELRSAIARSLERRGWQVASAPDGLQGLDAVRRRSFDVVISDVQMPGRGGLWLWREALKLRPELRGRFVLMSAEPLPDAVTLERSFESEQFFLKPFSLLTLASHVESIAHRPTEMLGRHSVAHPATRMGRPGKLDAAAGGRATRAAHPPQAHARHLAGENGRRS